MSTNGDDRDLQQAIENEFQCTRCGHCCKGDGIVRIGVQEADKMAQALGLTRHQFLKTYATRYGERAWVLRDRLVASPDPRGEPEKWCIFLERGSDGLYGCRVNGAKPRQCEDFPAKWRNLDSLTTCVGLRVLAAALRRRRQVESASQNP